MQAGRQAERHSLKSLTSYSISMQPPRHRYHIWHCDPGGNSRRDRPVLVALCVGRGVGRLAVLRLCRLAGREAEQRHLHMATAHARAERPALLLNHGLNLKQLASPVTFPSQVAMEQCRLHTISDAPNTRPPLVGMPVPRAYAFIATASPLRLPPPPSPAAPPRPPHNPGPPPSPPPCCRAGNGTRHISCTTSDAPNIHPGPCGDTGTACPPNASIATTQ